MDIRIRSTGGTPLGPDAPPRTGTPAPPTGRTPLPASPLDADTDTDTSGDTDIDADQLLSLHQRLLDDDGLPRDAALTLCAAPGPESMGGAWEAVGVVLTHATALANLALAVATWRRTHAEPPGVRIEANGVTVTLPAGQDHDAESVRRLLGALTPPPGDGHASGRPRRLPRRPHRHPHLRAPRPAARRRQQSAPAARDADRPRLVGLPAEHCTVLEQPAHPDEVLDAVRTAAEEARDTLLISYAGHGLIDPRASERADKLCLSLPNSHPSRLYGSIRYRDLRGLLLDARGALRKVVVLDCCFSGQAAVTTGPADLADEAGIQGAYVLASAGANAEAKAFAGERCTAFTGEFLNLLEECLPGGPELLALDTLYDHVRRAAHRKGLPEPRRSAADTAQHFAPVRNRAYTALPPDVLRRREVARLWAEPRSHYDERWEAADPPAVSTTPAPRTRAGSAFRCRPRPGSGPRRSGTRRTSARPAPWKLCAAAASRKHVAPGRCAVPRTGSPGAATTDGPAPEPAAAQRWFADVLRAAWQDGGAPALPELARPMGRTQTTVEELLTSGRFPTWRQVSAFAAACGVAPGSLDGAWTRTRLRLRRRRRTQRPAPHAHPLPVNAATMLLGDAPRTAFQLLELTPTLFAQERNLDPAAVARYTTGAEPPPWRFVHDLNVEVRARGDTGFTFQGQTLSQLYHAAEDAP
ncbi:effector-associated constant component EACC1 [Streptomyces axinellae]|uniref:Uncharacterized protein n=1 Tax=Streptomyces axinellae TaxID=552788 RepID=A0ABN3QJU5_9ACTN